jgi:hypothetical protein
MPTFDFEDPVDMLLVLDDELRMGRTTLHGWQMRVMKDFAVETIAAAPYCAVVRTCNGAGKDSKLIAPSSVWMANRYENCDCIVTSASSTQLDRQTAPRIHQLCTALNAKFGREIWKLNYRFYSNTETGSNIVLFVTDEAGRAEGWHPRVDNAQLAIFTSEAKSITEEIFHALARCTGFTKRMDCSTPGLPVGHFFDRCTRGNWKKYHITAYDCPHLNGEYIEQCKEDYGGESSALFKSMVMAEFATTDDLVVIPYDRVWRAIHKPITTHFEEEFNTGGLDLAAGGDENTFVVRNGNKVLKVYGFRLQDTAVTVRHLEKLFADNGMKNPNSYIFGDAGGLGKPILDQLKDRGWLNIRYVLNQGTPKDKKIYYNRGAELWFHTGRLFENGEVIIPNDGLLQKQLAARYYKLTPDNRVQMESKLVARSKGHCSPDRADALVLSFSNYKTKFNRDGEEVRELPMKKPKPVEAVEEFTMKGWAKRAAAPDEYEKFYGGRGDQRRNLDELQQLVTEYNAVKRKN